MNETKEGNTMADIASLGIKIDSKGVVSGQLDLEKFAKAGAKAESATDSLGTTVKRTAAAIGAMIASVNSISEITKFQDAMLGLQAVMGGTADQMAALETQARSLGASSIYSAEQTAQAQRYLAQAGLDVNEVLSATSGTLELATAGNLTLSESAGIAAGALRGFGIDAANVGRVNDVMAKTASSSGTTVAQLGEALSYAAPIAKIAGVSIEDASAAIGTLGTNNLKGSRAGTGLLGVIRQLSNLTPAATEALNSYGLTADDVSIESNGLMSVLNTLKTANINTADSFTIFGSEAAPAASILANNAASVLDLTEKLENSTGAAKEMSDIMSSGLSAAFKGFNSQVSESILQLGDSGLADALQEATEYATGLLAVYNGMIDEFAEANDLTDDQVESLESVAGVMKTTATIVAGGTAAFVAYRVAVNAATIATAAFNAATRANPIGLAAIAVGSLGAALYEMSTYSDTASSKVDKLTGSIDGLNAASLETQRIKINAEILDLETQLTKEKEKQAELEDEAQKAMGSGSSFGLGGTGTSAALLETGVAIDSITNNISKLEEQLTKIGTASQTVESTVSSFTIPAIVAQSGEDALIGIQGYTDEIERLQKAYASVTDPMEKLLADQKLINDLIAVASTDQLPALQTLADNIQAKIEEGASDGLEEGLENAQYNQVAMNLATALANGDYDSFGDAISSVISTATATSVTSSLSSSMSATTSGIFGGLAGAAVSVGLSSVFDSLTDEIETNYEDRQEEQGTGTVLGDIDAKSASIANGIETISDIADDLLGVNTSMLDALEDLSDSITDASTLISQDVSYDLGTGEGMSTVGSALSDLYDMNYDVANTLTLGMVDVVDDLFGGALSSISSSIFGGSSKTTDEGIKIIGGTLSDILSSTTAKAYQEITTDGGWFHSDSTKTYTSKVSSALEAQFDSIYQGIVDSVVSGAEIIGIADDEIASVIDSFKFSSVTISLDDMSSSEQESALEAVFSKALDQLTAAMFSELSEFQDTGESLGDTLSRVATEMSVAEVAIDRLGQSLDTGDWITNVEIAEIMTDASGSLDEFAENISGFTENFYSSAEQAQFYADDLTDALDEMGLTLPDTADGFRELVEAQDANTTSGAYNIATLLSLQEEMTEYLDLLEDADSTFDTITEFVSDLMGLAADGTTSLASAQAQYTAALEAAQAGDEDAIEDLATYADTYLDAVADAASTSAELAIARAGVISDLTGVTGEVPAFASGGTHMGGLALVGEQGPELVNLPPSTIHTNADSAKMLDNTSLLSEVMLLRQSMESVLYTIAINTNDISKLNKKWDVVGLNVNSTVVS